jgi:hypothetical protein
VTGSGAWNVLLVNMTKCVILYLTTYASITLVIQWHSLVAMHFYHCALLVN